MKVWVTRIALVLMWVGMPRAFGYDFHTYKFSHAVQQELANAPDSDARIKVLAKILDDKASRQADQIASFIQLGRIDTPTSADVLVNHITYHYTRDEIIYAPAEDALYSMGDVAVNPIMNYIEQHAPFKRDTDGSVSHAAHVLFLIKSPVFDTSKYDEFVKEYIASGLRHQEVIDALQSAMLR